MVESVVRRLRAMGRLADELSSCEIPLVERDAQLIHALVDQALAVLADPDDPDGSR